MPAINLPNDVSAIIATRAELSERSVRAIARSFMAAGATVSKMTSMGFVETDPSTWGVYNRLADEDIESVNAYQSVLILNMLKSWSRGDLPTADNVQDLPSALYQTLAAACAEEFNRTLEFGPDGANDPKAPTDA